MISYKDIDIEMHDVISALNTVRGIRTWDCCFGHPGIGRPVNHHTHAFIGITPDGEDEEPFNKFWYAFFDKYWGKVKVETLKYEDALVQFSVVRYLFIPKNKVYQNIRLKISSWHDPAMDPRGVEEKKAAFIILQNFITEYNKKQ